MPETLILKGSIIPLDKDGYLKNLKDWSPAVADEIARRENISLTNQHWEVINLLRIFYDNHGLAPMMRVLVKQMKISHGEEKGSSIYLLSLFPEYPALIANKIAGLPRPTNCP
ncbi:MAG: tRNA 2-thiouridine synthesizing protein E [Pseudohongiellaceae bacterium]|jgi:tRNA 2-thiouridine synthesizing protein E